MVHYNKIFEAMSKGNNMSDQAYAKAQAQPKTLIGSSPKSSLLQRTCACSQHTLAGGECEACRKKREGMLQRAAIGSPPVGEAPPIVQEVLRSPGQPLDTATRTFMEPRFGHDFSRVRVHTDERAAESARAVSARAYTVGGYQLTATSYALISLGEKAVVVLKPLLSDQRPAPQSGSKEATASSTYGNRVCDYAWIFICEIEHQPYSYSQNPAERDRAIEELRKSL